MRYNVYFMAGGWIKTLTLISKSELDVVLDAYGDGKSEFFINGRRLDISRLSLIKIYETDISDDDFNKYEAHLEEKKKRERFGILSSTWSAKSFEKNRKGNNRLTS